MTRIDVKYLQIPHVATHSDLHKQKNKSTLANYQQPQSIELHGMENPEF